MHARAEGGVGGGGGIDAAASGKNLGAGLDGLGEVAGNAGESGEEEIAEAVAFQVALGEAVLEEAGEQVLILGESDEAVAQVARGKNVEVFAEPAGGAAVVGDGDDRGELADKAGKIFAGGVGGRGCGRRSSDKALEPAQQGREAGAPADGDYAKLLGKDHASCLSVDGRRCAVAGGACRGVGQDSGYRSSVKRGSSTTPSKSESRRA